MSDYWPHTTSLAHLLPSSANLCNRTESECELLVFKAYSRGDKTHPWGAPVFKVLKEERSLPTLTACFLCNRKLKKKRHKDSFIPSTSMWENNLAGTVVLNAELKSMKRTRTYVDLLFRCCMMEWRQRDTASSTPLLAL